MIHNHLIKSFLVAIFVANTLSACNQKSGDSPEWITSKDAVVINEDSYIVSYDKNSIKKDGDITTLWTRQDWGSEIIPLLAKQGKVKKGMPQEEFESAMIAYIKSGTYLGTTLQFIEVNCNKNLLRTVKRAEYKNNILGAEEVATDETFTATPPGTVGQKFIGWACN